MGILKKVKKKMKENVYGDKRAIEEGSGGPPKTPRQKGQRKAFEKLKERQ
jgi:hypothetical protein